MSLQSGGKQPDTPTRVDKMSCLLEMPNPGLFGHIKTGCEVAPDKPSPRLIVTHLPLQFLPTQIWDKKPKVGIFFFFFFAFLDLDLVLCHGFDVFLCVFVCVCVGGGGGGGVVLQCYDQEKLSQIDTLAPKCL